MIRSKKWEWASHSVNSFLVKFAGAPTSNTLQTTTRTLPQARLHRCPAFAAAGGGAVCAAAAPPQTRKTADFPPPSPLRKTMRFFIATLAVAALVAAPAHGAWGMEGRVGGEVEARPAALLFVVAGRLSKAWGPSALRPLPPRCAGPASHWSALVHALGTAR